MRTVYYFNCFSVWLVTGFLSYWKFYSHWVLKTLIEMYRLKWLASVCLSTLCKAWRWQTRKQCFISHVINGDGHGVLTLESEQHSMDCCCITNNQNLSKQFKAATLCKHVFLKGMVKCMLLVDFFPGGTVIDYMYFLLWNLEEIVPYSAEWKIKCLILV